MAPFPVTLSELAAMKKNTLPNGGGTYLSPTTPPAGEYGSPTYVSPTVPIKSLFGENKAKTVDLAAPVVSPFKKGPASPGAPAGSTPANLDYSKYLNPTTGVPYTPQEYADTIAKRANGGVIPTYAGDSLTKGDQSATDLLKTGRELNNTRNDIATGATDPYGIASKSGIQYTPQELSAIEKAYAGIYDPAINDVFQKLDTKQKADAATATEAQKRSDAIFNTNENIRQWRATTGSKASSSNGDFTNTQIANGASNAGITLSEFNKLDPDIQNFYVNPPTVYNSTDQKMENVLDTYKKDIAAIKDGSKTVAEVTADINSGKDFPVAAKAVLINGLPDDHTSVAAKGSFWSDLLNGIGDVLQGK